MARRRRTAQALALRARIVLRAAAGLSNTAIADELGITKHTVGDLDKIRCFLPLTAGFNPHLHLTVRIGDAEHARATDLSSHMCARDHCTQLSGLLRRRAGRRQGPGARHPPAAFRRRPRAGGRRRAGRDGDHRAPLWQRHHRDAPYRRRGITLDRRGVPTAADCGSRSRMPVPPRAGRRNQPTRSWRVCSILKRPSPVLRQRDVQASGRQPAVGDRPQRPPLEGGDPPAVAYLYAPGRYRCRPASARRCDRAYGSGLPSFTRASLVPSADLPIDEDPFEEH